MPVCIEISLRPAQSAITYSSPTSTVRSIFTLFIRISLVPTPHSVKRSSNVIVVPTNNSTRATIRHKFQDITHLRVRNSGFRRRRRRCSSYAKRLHAVVRHRCVHVRRVHYGHRRKGQGRHHHGQRRVHFRRQPISQVSQQSPTFQHRRVTSTSHCDSSKRDGSSNSRPRGTQRRSSGGPIRPILRSIVVVATACGGRGVTNGGDGACGGTAYQPGPTDHRRPCVCRTITHYGHYTSDFLHVLVTIDSSVKQPITVIDNLTSESACSSYSGTISV